MIAPPIVTSGALTVLIAGGSIGGLATALALRAQGHHVKIYEQAFTPETKGAGITVFPNALSALKMLGIDSQAVKATRVKHITRVTTEDDGETDVAESDIDEKAWPWHHTTYPDLFVAMWEAVHVPSKSGPQIEVNTSKSVFRVDTTKGTLYFSDGSEATGDVIIGADGVHSVCRSYVPGGSIPRFRIKRHVFRALIPRETLAKDPRTAKYVEHDSHAYCYNHNDKSLLITPATNNQKVCVKFLYEDRMAFKNLSKDWRDPSSKTKLMRLAQDLPEECIALFEKICDRDLQDQPIWDMDPLTTFTSHRMALMGDAAHPMPPYCGQRIAMALEDALALGVILERGVPVDELEDRLRLYSTTRKQRAVAVQQTTRGLSEADMRNFATDFDTASFHTYILGHNEQQHMGQALNLWKRSRNPEDYQLRRPQVQVWADPAEAPRPRSARSPSPRKWLSISRKTSQAWSRVFSSKGSPVMAT
ncbi:salicylate hydroxylase [Exophiala viscosa]|uniref:Salicylate hydroxylase n=1 Tax=Exophiala viscosa TaxID=2486360 RepID=A0AAN6DX68_9EURO|nr:salicylate hydroxylase [Exophiala viscosa]KAI1626184.1 salicylate hydroxylase [Exophiala viscosa]